jgi:lipopolysaccharide biosynthesis regulator YciM
MWVEKATEQNPKAYWVRLLKAKIELKMGDKKAAIATANEVVAMATEAKNDDYVKMAKELIAKATN